MKTGNYANDNKKFLMMSFLHKILCTLNIHKFNTSTVSIGVVYMNCRHCNKANFTDDVGILLKAKEDAFIFKTELKLTRIILTEKMPSLTLKLKREYNQKERERNETIDALMLKLDGLKNEM